MSFYQYQCRYRLCLSVQFLINLHIDSWVVHWVAKKEFYAVFCTKSNLLIFSQNYVCTKLWSWTYSTPTYWTTLWQDLLYKENIVLINYLDHLRTSAILACWVDKCFSALVVFAPLHNITALHWLHTAELSSCLVKCSQALDRFPLSMMLPHGWRSESWQRVWRKYTATQNFRKTGKPRAGREMRESLRRIDDVRGVQFQWNWSAGTGSESELVLDSHPYTHHRVASETLNSSMVLSLCSCRLHSTLHVFSHIYDLPM